MNAVAADPEVLLDDLERDAPAAALAGSAHAVSGGSALDLRTDTGTVRAWSDAARRTIVEESWRGTPVSEIALRLGATPGQVRSQAVYLRRRGVALPTRPIRVTWVPFLPGDLDGAPAPADRQVADDALHRLVARWQRILDAWLTGRDLEGIAAEVDESPGRVAEILTALRQRGVVVPRRLPGGRGWAEPRPYLPLVVRPEHVRPALAAG